MLTAHFELEVVFIGHLDNLLLERLYLRSHVLVRCLELFLECTHFPFFAISHCLQISLMSYLHGLHPLILFCKLLFELLHLLLDSVSLLLRALLDLCIKFLNVRSRLELLILKTLTQLLAFNFF